MNIMNLKPLKIFHLIVGIIFLIIGILSVGNKHYIYSIWMISLGLLFLFDPICVIVGSKINQKTIKISHYVIGSIVFLTGSIVLLWEFGILPQA